MAWADWMVVKQSLEEELELERQVRDIESCRDLSALQSACGALTRQRWHHQQLLKQAVGRIAELDATVACFDGQSSD